MNYPSQTRCNASFANRVLSMKLRRVLSVVMVAVLFSAVSLAASAQKPDMNLMDLDGAPVSLNQRIGQGKWLLVMIWATDCVVCQAEKPKISAFHDKHKHDDAEVIGIALDGIDKKVAIEAYLQAHKTTFPTLTGDFLEISRHYEFVAKEPLRGTPTYLLYTPEGELVGNNPGPLSDGSIERFMEKYNRL